MLLTCNNTACGGICEPNAVAFSSIIIKELILCCFAKHYYLYVLLQQFKVNSILYFKGDCPYMVYIYLPGTWGGELMSSSCNKWHWRCSGECCVGSQVYVNIFIKLFYCIIGERSEPPLSVELSEFSLYLYIYIYYIYIYLFIASGASFLVCSIARAVYIYNYIYIIVRTSFRKCTSFLNSEYNFQFYWRVINVQQYRVRRNPRAQRCSVF